MYAHIIWTCTCIQALHMCILNTSMDTCRLHDVHACSLIRSYLQVRLFVYIIYMCTTKTSCCFFLPVTLSCLHYTVYEIPSTKVAYQCLLSYTHTYIQIHCLSQLNTIYILPLQPHSSIYTLLPSSLASKCIHPSPPKQVRSRLNIAMRVWSFERSSVRVCLTPIHHGRV